MRASFCAKSKSGQRGVSVKPVSARESAHRSPARCGGRWKRAWQSLEAAGLIEEPDPYNGKSGYRVISEKGKQVNTEVDIAKATVRAQVKPEMLDRALHGTCIRAFAAGDYDAAIFEAFKAVENAVRKKAGYPSADFGVALMRKAFDPNTGPLADGAATPSRRQARQHLLHGRDGQLGIPRRTVTRRLQAHGWRSRRS